MIDQAKIDRYMTEQLTAFEQHSERINRMTLRFWQAGALLASNNPLAYRAWRMVGAPV